MAIGVPEETVTPTSLRHLYGIEVAVACGSKKRADVSARHHSTSN
jgi:hypothetical protein